MGVSSYLIPIGVLLFLKFSPVQSQQFGSDFCANNFAIYENKIIRTEDSKKLGAKYLTSKDVTSRRECLKLCCLTHMCDVFIYEEKIPGTCYLFSCGPPDDFRCQFTPHGNYTSAVLSKPQPARLEEEIRLNQHESELTRLREPMESSIKEIDMIPSPPSPSTSTTTPPPPTYVQTEVQPAAASTQRTSCSRFQFECHTSKECIAIYNVCDGIPQCTDASDEATELACPTTALRSTSSTTSHRDLLLHNDELLPDMSLTPPPPAFARMMPPPQKLLSLEEQAAQVQQQNMNPMMLHNQQNVQWPVNNPIQYNKEMSGAYIDPNSGIMYRPSSGMDYNMREGERQQHINYHMNSNGMMAVNNRMMPHKSNAPLQSPDYPSLDSGILNSNNNVQYKGNQNISPYSYIPAYQHASSIQHANQQVSGLNNMEVSPVHQMNYMRPVEYYYDDTTHQQALQAMHQPQANVNTEHDVSVPVVRTSSSVQKQESPILPVSSVDVTTTPTVHTPHRRKDKHSRKQQMSTEILIKETVSEQYESFYPSSAIIVFTCGLFLTVTLAILLCCRLKMIRRRLRKGGKSAYAHDADFLVNGMYL